MHTASPPPVVSAHPNTTACCAPTAGIDPALDAERIAAAAKALAEPLRVQIVDVLRRSDQDVCQCALIAALGVHQSLLAYHMKKLIDVGLVQVERRHKWAYYSVSTDAAHELSAWLNSPLDRCQPRPVVTNTRKPARQRRLRA